MEIDFIIVNRKQFRIILGSFVLLALVSGLWCSIIINTLRSDSGFFGSLQWIDYLLFCLLAIFWFILIYTYRQTAKKWQQETIDLSEKQGLNFDEPLHAQTDVKSQQQETFASCRHKKLNSTLRELHSLITSHLNSVTGETNEAALALINQLKLIHNAMSQLLETVSINRKESDQIATGSQSTLVDNQATMDRLQTYINGRLYEIDHDHKMASELQEQAVIMADLTKLIESVAKQTTIVATNAKIEASRAGKFGKAFGVIADEVTKLSAQIGNSSKQIIQSIELMGKSIEEKFKAKLDKSTQSEETNLLNDLKNQLVKMGESYTQLEGFNRETLSKINSSSEDIKSKVNDSLMAIQFQDITQQQIEVILKSLRLFESHLSDQTCLNLVQTENEGYEEFDIDQIRNLYVMKKQHDIHNKHHKTQSLTRVQEKEKDVGEITLF